MLIILSTGWWFEKWWGYSSAIYIGTSSQWSCFLYCTNNVIHNPLFFWLFRQAPFWFIQLITDVPNPASSFQSLEWQLCSQSLLAIYEAGLIIMRLVVWEKSERAWVHLLSFNCRKMCFSGMLLYCCFFACQMKLYNLIILPQSSSQLQEMKVYFFRIGKEQVCYFKILFYPSETL